MSEKKINLSDRQELLLVILLGICGVIIWNIYYNSYEKVYSVAEVIGTSIGKGSGTVVRFSYRINGRKLESGTGLGNYKVRIGEKYIVEIAKDKTSLAKALFHYPVPDSVNFEVPWEGWKEVPSELKQFRRKRTELFGLYDKIVDKK